MKIPDAEGRGIVFSDHILEGESEAKGPVSGRSSTGPLGAGRDHRIVLLRLSLRNGNPIGELRIGRQLQEIPR